MIVVHQIKCSIINNGHLIKQINYLLNCSTGQLKGWIVHDENKDGEQD